MTPSQWLTGVTLLLMPFLAHAASPYEAVQQGNALYQQGKYQAAAEHYAIAAQVQPEATVIHFNRGNAAYKQGDYAQALTHYNRALDTTDRRLESRAKYNLGNVKYQQALHALQQPQEATTLLRTAMTYYRDSLEVDANQSDAQHNLELAQRLLQQLQQQQRQQKQQQSTDSQDRQQDQQQQQQDQQQQASSDAADNQQAQRDQQSPPQDTKQSQSPQDAQQQQAQPGDTPPEASQSQHAAAPEEMSAEEAARLLDAIRERGREVDAQRQQRRRAYHRGTRVDKDW